MVYLIQYILERQVVYHFIYITGYIATGCCRRFISRCKRVATTFTLAAQQLYLSYPHGKRCTGGTIITGKAAYFRRAFYKHLCAFGEVRCYGCTVGPVGAIYPGGFFLVVALAVLVLFCMGYRKVDNVFTVYCVYYAIFSKIANYLHFNHSAQY